MYKQFPFFIFFLSVSFCKAQMNNETKVYIDSVMNATYKSNEPGAVLLIAKDGKTLFKKAYGIASMELNVPDKPDNAFCIGSMTKQFTAVCILQLAQQGKLSLQDDIKKYLPCYNTHGRSITIEHLLSHTSGIRNRWSDASLSEEDEMKYLMKDSLLFEPGTDWSYSNAGYTLLAFIIEKVSGLSYSEYLQKNIFDIAGMKHSCCGTHEKIIPGLVNGYATGENDSIIPGDYTIWNWPIGGGNIISTADDMLNWDEALYTGKLVSQQLLQKAWTPYHLANGNKMYYGYGWSIQTVNGINCIQHGGELDGFMSSGVRIPSEHLYVIVLTNTEVKNPYYLSLNIALKAINKPIMKQVPVSLAIGKAQEYTGAYLIHHNNLPYICCFGVTNESSKEPAYRSVYAQGDTLYEKKGNKENPLIYLGNDVFCFKYHDTYFLKFHRDENKKITSVEIYSYPAYGPIEVEEKKNVSLSE